MTNSSQYSTDTAQEDIVTRLREQALAPALTWLAEAVGEIQRLRSALDAEGNEANLLMLEIERLRELNDDLAARINWLITTFSSYDEDGLFAFPDGAHWGKPRD